MDPDDGRSQTDVVIEGIKAMITGGQLGPGDRLPVEKELAARLGVSRGPLREGVRALVILGVLGTRRGDGTYVTALDPARLLSPVGFLSELHSPATSAHLLEVRRVLEAETAARAALALTDEQLDELERLLDTIDGLLAAGTDVDLTAFIEADTEFHRLIARAGGNPVMAALVEGLFSHTFRTRMWRALVERDAVDEAQSEHRAILTALRRRDSDRARLRMSVHLLGVEEFAVDHAV
ncbi:FadR/GntR family transcriptional regulator [Actinoplanes couchii]|uniref:GntR family transcriptional regulator n=1 Tax=Actinoplanes couchii TaxID=403638 RepID=A0ABQ3X8G9_9ACTN|nr:FadR/GntR family transcriptional regulator [Actinoplanes couchii]MDR6320186.1 DNA-binding FadR family transcriptional regulator [Actinoplanes couchii]GID54800.1 GntR family transcriptional regulator [Actinoplanes couchii]